MRNISAIDLNLLLVLHTVLELRSATLAARRLHVTQSAVSNALARLRRVFGDPLVVRSARGLTPTPRALALQPALAVAIRGLEAVLAADVRFDPATTTREFTLACVDYYGVVLLPPLLERLRAEAPAARLRLVPLEHLARGGGLADDIDVHVGMPPELQPGCHAVPLFTDRFVCMCQDRGRRPARMGIKEYLAATHVRVRVLDVARDPIDVQLAARGLARAIGLTLPHFSLVPLVVARAGHVATLSRRLAEVYAGLLPLRLREPPIDMPARAVQMIWHQRTDDDPGARFLRGLIRDVAA